MATHPILAYAGAVEAGLKDVEGVEPVFMSTADKEAALLALDRAESRHRALRLRVLAAADDVADAHAVRDAAAWTANATRKDPASARADLRLAQALDRRWHRLSAALSEGAANTAQAQVIAQALEDLPDDLDPEVRERAETHLVGLTDEFGPKQLRILGRRVLDVVAPDVAGAHEQLLLERQETAARRHTWLTTRNGGDGTVLVSARLPDVAAGRLLTCLHAYTNPRRREGARESHPLSPGASAVGAREPYRVQLGRAFCSLLEHLDPARLPIHGGAATSLTVNVDLETLIRGLGTALTSTGERISAGEARRLACTAGIIPAVLGGASELLDHGRSQRLFSRSQRKALEIRDRSCRAEGCDVPAAWTEAHHTRPWSRGGGTDLADGVLLCPHHHHRAHDPGHVATRLPNGDVRFHRRT
ncbi:MAG: DUF222 domain-containing protein [Marmoricola sp.]